MIKKRMTLSIVTLIGSVFLFVIASFAWFAVSNQTNSDGIVLENEDIDVSAVFYDSDDDISYSVATSIDFNNATPGDVKYYKLVVTNNNAFSINTQVFLYGYTNSYANEGGDVSNNAAGRKLATVTLLNASNNIDLVTIEDRNVHQELSDNRLVTHDYVTIPANSTGEFYFSFTIPVTVGNDYGNLKFSFTNIYVSSFKAGWYVWREETY